MAAQRKRALTVALVVLLLLVVAVVLTRRRDEAPSARGEAEERRVEPRVDCAKVTKSPDAVAKQRDPRRFAEAYLCAWARREVDGMRKTTLAPNELDQVLRPTIGPEAAAERRGVIRRRVLDAYLNLPQQVVNILDDVTFYIDGVEPLPRDLETVFEEGAQPRMLHFRAQAPGEEMEALRTVLAKAGDGGWRFVPGIADPQEVPSVEIKTTKRKR